MKQTDHERPSRDPTRIGWVEFGENVAGIVAAVLRNGKDANDDGNHTGKGPEDGKGLEVVSNSYNSDRMGFVLTSNHGSHLFPRAETSVQNSVMARKMRYTCHADPARIPTAGSVSVAGTESKTLMHATKKRAVANWTERVIVMLPTTKHQPQIQEAILRYEGGAIIKVW